MMIYDILKKEHQEVKGLLNQLIALSDDDESRFDLAEQIHEALIPHSRAEEAVFYNAIRALDADSSKIMHGYKEHMEAEMLLRTLEAKEKVKLDWKATARKLRDALDHHVQEEESVIFASGKKVLSDQDAMQIGEAFEKMKAEIKDESFIGSTFELVKNLMPPRLSKILGNENSKNLRQ